MSADSAQALPTGAILASEDFVGREWVLDRVDAWLAGAQPSLLITGPPGTGKTAVAARIGAISNGNAPAIGRLRLREGAITYQHFCRALDPAALDPVQFVESLARDLASRCEPYARALLELGDQRIEIRGHAEVGHAERGAHISGVHIENLRVGDLSAALAFERLVRRPLSQLEQPVATEFVVLVDALDEALTLPGEETLVNLVADVLSAGGLPSSIRFLLTSRPDQRAVGRLPGPRLDLLHDAPADVDDVRRYAETRLASLGQRQSRELASLVARAGRGNFLYARYVLRDLLAHPALPQFDQIELPAGLDEHYRQFLRRELTRSDENWEERYRPVLALLTIAQGDGLTRELLTSATNLAGSRIDTALRRLGQYLEGPFPEGPFRIYHQSFRDFLASDPDSDLR